LIGLIEDMKMEAAEVECIPFDKKEEFT